VPGAPRGAPPDYALAELSPTARRILEREGYEGLTLRRIGEEVGETKSLIVCHFGGKDGLIAVLVDSLWHEEKGLGTAPFRDHILLRRQAQPAHRGTRGAALPR